MTQSVDSGHPESSPGLPDENGETFPNGIKEFHQGPLKTEVKRKIGQLGLNGSISSLVRLFSFPCW